jgi:prolyl-tRNA synthetase
MKFSKLFVPTTKETPSDATLPSHQYLVRGDLSLKRVLEFMILCL